MRAKAKRDIPYAAMCGLLGLLTLGMLWGVAGCADVLFERGPYAIRGINVVYSEQEDLTFISWRLRGDADPTRVEFELYRDGAFTPIDLNATPFPAEPYPCDGDFLCFQYQVLGSYSVPDQELMPLRSVHETEGIYAGVEPEYYTTRWSYFLDPIALEQNTVIDLKRIDWFSRENIPLKRNWQWQVVSSSADYGQGGPEVCATLSDRAWEVDNDAVELDPAWVEEPKCLAMRPEPKRSELAGWTPSHIVQPVLPSAEVSTEIQFYQPGESRPRVLYGFLIDLFVRSPERCEQVKTNIVNAVDQAFQSRTGDLSRLGVFTPLDPLSGEPTNGCSQNAGDDLPVTAMASALQRAAAQIYPTDVRVVWIYLNNIELPPSERRLFQLEALASGVFAVENVALYGWAIASDVILSLLPWNWTTGWRPISEQTLFDDIDTFARKTIPFRSLNHSRKTHISIERPVNAARPKQFKMCGVVGGELYGIGLQPGGEVLPPTQTAFMWPESNLPHYRIDIPEQKLVPFTAFRRVEVEAAIETCSRFCDFPFRGSSGFDYPSWSNVEECQWQL